jgi:hypothetical protein
MQASTGIQSWRACCVHGALTALVVILTLQDLSEPSTCKYIAAVHTPLLCEHPQYRISEEKVQSITCVELSSK